MTSTQHVRTTRTATLSLTLLWSWSVMVLAHELGHVIGGVASGGVLSALEIRPWQLPLSLFSPDPNPLITLWSGPIFGSAVPLMIAVCTGKPMIWFIAWFCVLANAVYLLLGYFSGDAELDSTKIIKAGSPAMLLFLFVAMTGPVSYVAFRQQCVDLMSNPQRALTKRSWRISAAGLLTLLVVQAIAGTLLAS